MEKMSEEFEHLKGKTITKCRIIESDNGVREFLVLDFTDNSKIVFMSISAYEDSGIQEVTDEDVYFSKEDKRVLFGVENR